MIRTIHLQGFESHVNSSIELGPGVNAIVGASDSGKSSILKALRLIQFGRPSGDAYIHAREKQSKITIEFDDGVVTKEKGKVNQFSLKTEEGEKSWKGANIPADVEKFVNLNSINFQFQFDSPFLVSLSPPAAAKEINEAANLDKADSSLTNISRASRRLKSKLMDKKESLDELKEERNELKYLDEAEGAFSAIENLDREIRALESQQSELQGLLDHKQALLEKREQLDQDDLTNAKSALNTIENQIKEIENLEKGLDELSSLIDKSADLRQQREALVEERVDLEETLKKTMPNICPLCGQGIKK